LVIASCITTLAEEIAYKVGSRNIYEDRTYLFSLPADNSIGYYYTSHGEVYQDEVANFVRDTMGYRSGWKGGSGFGPTGGEVDAIDGDGHPYIFRLEFNDDKRKATLRIYDNDTEDGEEKCVEEQELVVKKEGDLLYVFRVDK
jgi:hypothetical protein